MISSLRSQLLGTWELESYADITDDGSVVSGPFGDGAKGMLIYAPDGFMSAQLARPDRRPFASCDWFAPTPAELDEAAQFVSYCGRYSVNENTQSVIHEVALSFFPNLEGHAQFRRVRLEEHRLILIPDKPILSVEKLVTPRLTWVRPA